MKKLFLLMLICFIFPFSINAKVKPYKNKYRLPTALSKEIANYSKEKLEYLASVYVALAERFYQIKYKKDARACFMYAIQIYPVGSSAQKAKESLLKYYKIKIP